MTNPPIGASPASGSLQAPDEPLQPTPQGSEGLVERLRASVREIGQTNGRGMHGGDLELMDAAADRIEALEGERDSAVSQREGGDSSSQSQPGYDGERAASATQSLLRLSGFTPFRIVETPDYAEVHAANGDGKHAFCLTTSPSFFEELNAIAEGKS